LFQRECLIFLEFNVLICAAQLFFNSKKEVFYDVGKDIYGTDDILPDALCDKVHHKSHRDVVVHSIVK